MADQVTYTIKRHLRVLSVNEKSDWCLEANIVSWNNGPDKLDIRAWSPDHTKMSKGITLKDEEAKELFNVLDEVYGNYTYTSSTSPVDDFLDELSKLPDK